MGHRPSCRSCRHCASSPGAAAGWCHLRRLAIHSAHSSELWCHHWTARPPRLPLGDPQDPQADSNAGLASPDQTLASVTGQTQPGRSEGVLARTDESVADHAVFGGPSMFGGSQQLSLEALLPHY
ncbi:hypothetical protein CyaNS01_02920 [Cyanobium sp. NS01]|nr:hypothetical protein CyaNS01_02920 [Cyanobium sp. NS01]